MLIYCDSLMGFLHTHTHTHTVVKGYKEGGFGWEWSQFWEKTGVVYNVWSQLTKEKKSFVWSVKLFYKK